MTAVLDGCHLKCQSRITIKTPFSSRTTGPTALSSGPFEHTKGTQRRKNRLTSSPPANLREETRSVALMSTHPQSTEATTSIDTQDKTTTDTRESGRATTTDIPATLVDTTESSQQSATPGIATIGTSQLSNTALTTGNTATSSTTNNVCSLTISAFNCKGFKQSVMYISQLLCQHDIIGLSETWLRPGELCNIKPSLQNIPSDGSPLRNKDIRVFSKSAMEHIGGGYLGRPFGGVSLICKFKQGVFYNEIQTMSDRIVAVSVSNNTSIAQVIVNVYMPFYKPGDYKQTDSFIETIDALQCIIDKYGPICPIRIIGDLNVKLPRRPAGDTWYRQKGYKEHSRIMMDFIVANNLSVSDFEYDQQSNYTYFCEPNNTYTWIDHCLSTSNSVTKKCEIMAFDPCNVSDHLPLSMTIEFQLSSITATGTSVTFWAYHTLLAVTAYLRLV